MSPSQLLVWALTLVNYHHALPSTQAGKVDLSYANPRKAYQKNHWNSLRQSSFRIRGKQTDRKSIVNFIIRIPQQSLQSIVAKYILLRGSVRARAAQSSAQNDTMKLDDHFSEAELVFLFKRGYSPVDVRQWARALLARSVYSSAKHLGLGKDRHACYGSREVPLFLVLFLLRRRLIMARTLKLILLHLWRRHDDFAQHFYKGREDEETISPMLVGSVTSGEKVYKNSILERGPTNFILVVRLIRQALAVWPAATVNIAALAIELLEGKPPGGLAGPGVTLSNEQIARLSDWYNRILLLLSHPAAIDRYKSTVFLQRAQFDLLRHMAEHRPPLIVTQEGYRSIVRVQLARPKTSKEQDWANLKAKTWPPWKADKTGLDAEKGLEYSLTRAAMAIRRMQEAGYGATTWEDIAKVYTGWNTDGTPTIQRRFLLRPPPEPPKRSDPSEGKRLQGELWAARIRATRTVREAWACFLSSKDQKVPGRSAIYTSMLEKLVYEERRLAVDNKLHPITTELSGAEEVRKQCSFDGLPLPGDGNEVHAPPTSPLESMYLPSEPPSVATLLDEMMKCKIKVSEACLRFMIDNAGSLRQVLSYLQKAAQGRKYRHLTEPQKRYWLHHKSSMTTLTSLVRAYCRFSVEDPFDTIPRRYAQFYSIDGWVLYKQKSFFHAIRLLEELRPHHRPVWNSALGSLRTEMEFVDTEAYGPSADAINRIMSFVIARRLVSTMRGIGLDPDTYTFMPICSVVERAVIASYKFKAQAENAGLNMQSDRWVLPAKAFQVADEVIAKGSSYLMDTFVFLAHGTENVGRSPDGLLNHKRPSDGFSDELNCDSHTLLDFEESTDPQDPSMPRLLHTPSPVALHAFVRALGLAKDFTALLNLTRWMVHHKSELDIQLDETRNGRKQMRLTIVALAVFMERSSFRVDPDSAVSDPLQDLVSECRLLIDNAGGDWARWPADQEIEAYLAPRGKLEADEWLQYL